MKSILIILACFFISSVHAESLEEWLYTQIAEYEKCFSQLNDSSDVYTHYYILGKQMAYRDVIEKLEEGYPELLSHAD